MTNNTQLAHPANIVHAMTASNTCFIDGCTNTQYANTPACLECNTEAYHRKMHEQVNYSDVCTCTQVHDSIRACSYCATEPMTVSINDMPDDIAFITTPQLAHLIWTARHASMMDSLTKRDTMYDIISTCIDELSRRNIRL